MPSRDCDRIIALRLASLLPAGLYRMTWKFLLLVSAPVGVVTTTGPVVAPVGTTAVRYVQTVFEYFIGMQVAYTEPRRGLILPAKRNAGQCERICSPQNPQGDVTDDLAFHRRFVPSSPHRAVCSLVYNPSIQTLAAQDLARKASEAIAFATARD